jgi:hypothetical protein
VSGIEGDELSGWVEPDPAGRARRLADAEAAHAAVRAKRAAEDAAILAKREAQRQKALARRSPGFYWVCENRDYEMPVVAEWTEDGEWKLPGDDCWLEERHIAKVYETPIEPPE